jgi:hypothetical protein
MPKLLNGTNDPMLPADVPLCSARCRTRGGEPCRNAAMPSGRCRMHGGKSLWLSFVEEERQHVGI